MKIDNSALLAECKRFIAIFLTVAFLKLELKSSKQSTNCNCSMNNLNGELIVFDELS